MVHRVALQGADVDAVVDHVAAAAGLAGVLAHQGAGGGEGVVLADEAHGVGIALIAHQGHIARYVHAGGAQGHAGHRLVQLQQAAAVDDVLHIVVAEADDAPQHHVGGLKADGAVRRVLDDPGGALDQVDGIQGGVAVQHIFQQLGQLAQAHAAGHTLAAGLCMAQLEEGDGEVHRAQARRAGDDAPFYVAVEPLYHALGGIGGDDVQSAHYCWPPYAARGPPSLKRQNLSLFLFYYNANRRAAQWKYTRGAGKQGAMGGTAFIIKGKRVRRQ